MRLKDVPTIQTGKGPTVIMHYNRQRAATLFAGTDKTKPMGEAMADLNQIVKKNLIAGHLHPLCRHGRRHAGFVQEHRLRAGHRRHHGLHDPGIPVRELRPSLYDHVLAAR